MAGLAADDGVDLVVATPHSFDGVYDVDPGIRDRKLVELRRAIGAEGLGLKLLSGSDCHISEHLIPVLKTSPAHSLNANGRTFLIEWPEGLVPAGFSRFLFEDS